MEISYKRDLANKEDLFSAIVSARYHAHESRQTIYRITITNAIEAEQLVRLLMERPPTREMEPVNLRKAIVKSLRDGTVTVYGISINVLPGLLND